MKLNLAAPLDVADMLTGPSGTSSDDVTDEASPAGIALAGLTELIDAQRNSDVVETTALPPAGDDLSGRVAKAKSDAAAFLESLSRAGRSCIKVLSVSCARRVLPRNEKTKRFMKGAKATFVLKERVSALDKISTLVEAACLFKRHRKMGTKFVSTVFPKARFHFIGNRCGYVVEVPQLVFVEIAADDAPGRVSSWGTHPKPKVTQRPPKRNVEAIGLAGSAPLPNKRSRKAVLPFCPCDPSGGASAWKEPKTPSPVVYAVGGDEDEDEDFTGGEAAVEDYEG